MRKQLAARLALVPLLLLVAGAAGDTAACAAGACCKVCRKGKACGDSCIAADRQCKKGKGCACDG